MIPWLWAIRDADEAELRGDAAGALEVMARRPLDPDGKPFWRPSRRRWLEQLVSFGDDVPGWARSRWVVEQALQHLDVRDRGPSSPRVRALAAARSIHGRRRTDLDLVDFDFFYRQFFLYDAGGLARFVRDVAPSDLVAGADRVDEWPTATLRGLRLVGRSHDRLHWTPSCDGPDDPADLDLLSTPNIGTAATMFDGECAVGRVVPVRDGLMFDGTVLGVPRSVAAAVEAAPASWLTIFRGHADLVRDGTINPRHAAWRGLMNDLPFDVVGSLLDDCPVTHPTAPPGSPAARARAAVELAGHHRLTEILRVAILAAGDSPDDLLQPSDDVAIVHGALTDPAIVAALADEARPGDRTALLHALDHLVEPGRSVVARLLDALTAAA